MIHPSATAPTRPQQTAPAAPANVVSQTKRQAPGTRIFTTFRRPPPALPKLNTYTGAFSDSLEAVSALSKTGSLESICYSIAKLRPDNSSKSPPLSAASADHVKRLPISAGRSFYLRGTLSVCCKCSRCRGRRDALRGQSIARSVRCKGSPIRPRVSVRLATVVYILIIRLGESGLHPEFQDSSNGAEDEVKKSLDKSTGVISRCCANHLRIIRKVYLQYVPQRVR